MNSISARALHGIYLRTRRSLDNTAARSGRDRLSELPDDILLNILERVNTLDALRTCILSKRLMRLPGMLSRFDIDNGSLVCHHDTLSHIFNTEHIARYNNVVARIIEKVLRAKSLDTSIIHELRVGCYSRPDECLPITRAFASIMATHKVVKAEFVALVEKPFPKCTENDLSRYAWWFSMCLSACPSAFAGLTSLWLENMRFDGRMDISDILSTCKQLEYLCLTHCDAGLQSVLLVEHDQLVELIVEYGQFGSVHLNRVPKLQHLTRTGWWYPEPLTFGYVPQLSKLSLIKRGTCSTMNLKLSQLLANAPSIRDLHMDFESEQIWVVPECPKLLTPVLRKLEIVNLDNLPEDCDVAWTMFILEAAPYLRELCITVWDHWCNMPIDQDTLWEGELYEKAKYERQPSASVFKHKNLVKLTIHGFQTKENMVQYVSRIMKVAVNIGEISLHDKEACGICPSTYPKTSEEKDMLRMKMTKGLRLAASPAVIHFRS